MYCEKGHNYDKKVNSVPKAEVKIPKATLKRLPLYYRFVNTLHSAKVDRVSSKELSEGLKIDSATIRRDFSYFGELGKKGYGYNVEYLLNFFKTTLQQDTMTKVAIIGIGHLGHALVNYNFSISDRMQIEAAFDIAPNVVGEKIGEIYVQHMDDFEEVIEKLGIEVVILTVPGKIGQEIANRVTKAGIKGILNFTPERLNVPSDVQVHHIDLGVELQSLIFFMKNH
ncbi:redox-sensing transcriptional repressor Rex [Macrococcus bovicus]|uniref:Redox-sensing transcriptional repressor Rex n=1 Tax=Macrococcus bovicus TaxID=69968 RepID=A0A4R6C0H9_9STAP|nr:redox-sensing transcriptional repressor Rex [Macrococcus bovicus]TDM14033.1 redox-sensing transcriptional repressor Rex [Macrococcus bovicus]WJP97544.1 redox-sensing transcriptional repressor Rex [Macrococcus bovicus]